MEEKRREEEKEEKRREEKNKERKNERKKERRTNERKEGERKEGETARKREATMFQYLSSFFRGGDSESASDSRESGVVKIGPQAASSQTRRAANEGEREERERRREGEREGKEEYRLGENKNGVAADNRQMQRHEGRRLQSQRGDGDERVSFPAREGQRTGASDAEMAFQEARIPMAARA